MLLCICLAGLIIRHPFFDPLQEDELYDDGSFWEVKKCFFLVQNHQIARSDWLARGPESYDKTPDSGPLTAQCCQKNNNNRIVLPTVLAIIVFKNGM